MRSFFQSSQFRHSRVSTMPPQKKTPGKRTPGSAGAKKTTARAAKSAQKKQNPPEVQEEKIEQAPDPVVIEIKEDPVVVEVKEDIKVVEEIVEQEQEPKEENSLEPKSEANGSLSAKGMIFIALYGKFMFKILVFVGFEAFEGFSIKKVYLGYPQNSCFLFAFSLYCFVTVDM